MSKAFISKVLQQSTEVTGAAANRATNDLIDSIVREMKKSGKFTLPSFGTFTVRKTKARKALNPRTGRVVLEFNGRIAGGGLILATDSLGAKTAVETAVDLPALAARLNRQLEGLAPAERIARLGTSQRRTKGSEPSTAARMATRSWAT